MRRDLDAGQVRAALLQRLGAAAEALEVARPTEQSDPAALVSSLVDRAREDPTTATTWLLLVALTAALPTDADVRAARRLVLAERTDRAVVRLLDDALVAYAWSDPVAELDVLVGGVLVDVDYSAQHDLSTGIQRVVRRTVPHWATTQDVTLVAWAAWESMRRLTEAETDRILTWSGPTGRPRTRVEHARVVVPWRGTVLLPEVPSRRACAPLAALAQHSGSAVGLIGYDCIPAVSADLLPPEEPERFVHYLTLVKHAHRVSAISDCAAQEFAGFVAMLPAQGLTGPQVTACLLPGEPPPPTSGPDPAPELPTVVVVGSHEPRKNHLAVLHASEVLWREGHRFAVRFIGGASWASDAFDAQVRRLRSAGRPVEVDRSVDDDALWSAYRTATFTVFTSLHEGFGLPVVESLAAGTPVVTSDLGSLAEVAAPGGAVTIDPRDDDALVAAMRALLTDEALRTRLVAEALARPARGWADYAAETWAQLTARGPG